MQIRIGSPTAAPIAEIKELGFPAPIEGGRPVTGWHYLKESIKLDKPLQPGIYNLNE